MHKRLLISSLLLLVIIGGKAQEETIVFQSNAEGYASYRIPAIIKAPNGTLLAFCEGRVNNAGDYGNVDIVLKRSRNGGKTWGPLQLVVNNDSLQAGNPAPVVDYTDPKYPKGRIFLFYNTGNHHEAAVRQGAGVREVGYITSTDNGQSWSAPVNITTQVHRPLQPGFNPKYNFKEDWRSYANTPGHAMQFADGPYKGRMYIAANHSEGAPQQQFEDYVAHGFFTDDHGKTFSVSANVPIKGSNESTAAPLCNGKLIMNSRYQTGTVKRRIVSVSSNGGQTWDTTYFDPNLPDPVNEGSLISFRSGKASILAFSNAAHESKRDQLTLRLSRDGGKTWYRSITVAASGAGYKGSSYAAYSDLVLPNMKTIGVLFEKEGYSTIVYRNIPIAH
ncbi:sialidase family protein [Niabella drilacis]|uniref:exo-alpha-sialidase n=1 Tax=Niabella drilacis (strain DSM 25811 / CCM 8410 / CCUG 62505 / LMG 26954 / E90) TaxID=1285928 RepID=A0A1G7ABF8_NIADE|nr:sialidase family protein [Niabella drilacis]SDE12244.1 sialidase-1 [Niabella drilacis]